MAAANPAESLQDEASCSICLDYFTDPVMTDCGHNFCRSCITQSWEGRDTDFPCPQCRETSQQRNLRPNRQLANVTEMVKKLSQTSARPKEENLCEEHEEKLKLFCEEDQKIICLICRESRDHKSHTVIPIKEAVQEYKEKLKMHLKPVKKNLEDLEKFKSTEEKKAEKLRDVKDALSRCQKMTFPVPEAVSTDLKLGFQLSFPQQLKKWITKFEGMDWWMEFGRYTVNLTLDPETAGPDLVLSEDRKSVRMGYTRQKVPDTPERFVTYPCVLGSEGFTSGRHYWEVEVGDGSYCILGVCKDCVRRKGGIKLSPEEGFWTVGLWNKQGCWTLTSPKTQISLSEFPRAVGILLDYEAGKVSFYDAENKSHLFTFTDSFTGKLRPFFMNYSKFPLRIRQVPT
ncbi:E3 ubiquitin-protein ligase TRIM39-like isoform X5 [Microcaecilia unicolor]|uniref:RING-type E3 ubiquitin transferase n=1 Tax=Microcaecilia unicolor TaxID=1415580 RepID=A0A6P7XT41_9AMPH|nr:E3 ubiquitin-protein ligase TRIM39-like isoform X5 [Microcaecilia unicolor]